MCHLWISRKFNDWIMRNARYCRRKTHFHFPQHYNYCYILSGCNCDVAQRNSKFHIKFDDKKCEQGPVMRRHKRSTSFSGSTKVVVSTGSDVTLNCSAPCPLCHIQMVGMGLFSDQRTAVDQWSGTQGRLSPPGSWRHPPWVMEKSPPEWNFHIPKPKKNPPSPKMEAFASIPPWLDAPAGTGRSRVELC